MNWSKPIIMISAETRMMRSVFVTVYPPMVNRPSLCTGFGKRV